MSTVGCQSGVVCVYDSLSVQRNCVYDSSMVHVPSSDLRIVMMDVAKQSDSSDCGVLAIAYAFDVRSDHSKIRQHLAMCPENFQASQFPIMGDRVSVQRKPKTVELLCSCHMPERDGEKFAV